MRFVQFKGKKMIISEKHILKLLRIAESYCHALHKFGEHKSVESIQDLLVTISDQQSEELKEIE
jgi:hypothetical protein